MTDYEKALQHFGIPGMKWGRRKAKSISESYKKNKIIRTEAKLEKRERKERIEWSKKSGSRFVDAHNATAKEINNWLPGYNKSWESKMKGYSDWEKSPKFKDYLKGYSKKYENALNTYAKKDPNHNVRQSKSTMTQRYFVSDDGVASWDIGNVKHTLKSSFNILVLDKNGKILPIELMDEEILNYGQALAHFGIPGMKWGRSKAYTKQIISDYKRKRAIRKFNDPSTTYKNRDKISTKQLEKKVHRMKLESDLRKLSNEKRRRGSDAVNSILAYGTTMVTAYTLYKSPIGQSIKKAIEFKLTKGLI